MQFSYIYDRDKAEFESTKLAHSNKHLILDLNLHLEYFSLLACLFVI